MRITQSKGKNAEAALQAKSVWNEIERLAAEHPDAMRMHYISGRVVHEYGKAGGLSYLTHLPQTYKKKVLDE